MSITFVLHFVFRCWPIR